MPLVDRVEDRLPDEMGRDRLALQVVPLQHVANPPAIGRILHRLLHLEMVAPAGELDAVVAELLGFAGHLLEGQIGPLAGEEGDRTWHVRNLSLVENRDCPRRRQVVIS